MWSMVWRITLKIKSADRETEAINVLEHVITSQNSLIYKMYSLTEHTNSWVKK